MPEPVARDYELYDEAYRRMATAKNGAEARELFVRTAIAVARHEGWLEGYDGASIGCGDCVIGPTGWW